MFDFSDTPRPVPLQQHPNFAAALQACGRTPLVVGQSQPVIALRRVFWPGLPAAMLARVTLSGDTAADRLGDWLAQAGLGRTPLILSPDHRAPDLARLGAVPLVTPASVAELDLSGTDAYRRARLQQKWRNRLAHGERQGLRVTCEPLPDAPGHWLLAADRALQRQRGYRGWPEALTLAYARANPGQAVLFTASEGPNPVAAMLFLRHGDGATYHIGHSTPRGRWLSAHTLLLWQAACWLAANGHSQLDLGLINTEDAAGLARFKLGSGAKARRLGGTWVWWPPLGRALRPLAALDRRVM